MNVERKIEVLKGMASRRDAAYAELSLAFPNGRPEGHARGYDDRRAVCRDHDERCDQLAQQIYAILGSEE